MSEQMLIVAHDTTYTVWMSAKKALKRKLVIVWCDLDATLHSNKLSVFGTERKGVRHGR